MIHPLGQTETHAEQAVQSIDEAKLISLFCVLYKKSLVIFIVLFYLQAMCSRIIFAGFPPINTFEGKDLVTTAFAATTQPSPIVTPFKIIHLVPISTSSSMVMGISFLFV